MTQVTLIGLFGLLIIGGTKAELKCGPNEIAIDCATDCETDYCPKSKGPYQACPVPEECPGPACKCAFNHRRAENGTCIPTRLCLPFQCNGSNEVYTPCPPLCTDNCSNATPDGGCPPTFGFIGIVLPCSPTCRCVKGYWRLNGECIPYAQCPKN